VYLNPRGPYDLGIVKYDRIDPANYYTMSRAGVTHFFESETEFTSLDQWEREYFLYTKMMEIPFFKKYRKWKAFYIWKKDIRRRKNQQCAKNLGENLFLLNKYLRKSLIELKQECYAASQWTLFKVTNTHSPHHIDSY
jgi:dynein heavy chain